MRYVPLEIRVGREGDLVEIKDGYDRVVPEDDFEHRLLWSLLVGHVRPHHVLDPRHGSLRERLFDSWVEGRCRAIRAFCDHRGDPTGEEEVI